MPVDNGSPASKRGATPPGGATTFDLFSWSEGPDTTRSPVPVRHTATNDSNAFLSAADQSTCESPVGRPTIRMHQPAGGVSTITFGEHLSAEEAEALLRRRPGSESKKKEMNGNGIFDGDSSDRGDGKGTPLDRTSVRCQKQARRPNSNAKARELVGSNIFGAPISPCRSPPPAPKVNWEPEEMKCPPHDLHRNPAGGVSQISFGGEECESPKKPVTIPEVAKQKELSGTVETTDDLTARRGFSHAKYKELEGNNIFGDAPPEAPKPSRTQEVRAEVKGHDEVLPRNVRTSVKVSNPAGGRSQISFGPRDETEAFSRRVHDQKKAELSGHDIFNEEVGVPSEKSLHHQPSKAKLREMSGSDIFSDFKPAGRDSIGGIRKPPGGGSTIALT